MRMRKRIAVIAASAIMLTGTLPQITLTVCAEETQQTTTMYATANVNVRAGDSTSAKKLGTLAKGQAIAASGKTEKGWYIVDFNGQTGYVSGKYLTDTNSTTPVPETTTPVAESTPTSTIADGTKKNTADNTVFVARGKTPRGLTIWYVEGDKATWPDYMITAYDATGITDDMSDYDKAVAINNYVCQVVDYAYENGVDDRAAYSACLSYGKAICTGYSHAFACLCTMAGISNDQVVGLANGASHAWNSVWIGNTKYWVDPTYNDSTNNAYLMSATPFADHEIGY